MFASAESMIWGCLPVLLAGAAILPLSAQAGKSIKNLLPFFLVTNVATLALYAAYQGPVTWWLASGSSFLIGMAGIAAFVAGRADPNQR